MRRALGVRRGLVGSRAVDRGLLVDRGLAGQLVAGRGGPATGFRRGLRRLVALASVGGVGRGNSVGVVSLGLLYGCAVRAVGVVNVVGLLLRGPGC